MLVLCMFMCCFVVLFSFLRYRCGEITTHNGIVHLGDWKWGLGWNCEGQLIKKNNIISILKAMW